MTIENARKIDIDKALVGMNVINQEKAEIKLLVQLLAPGLKDLTVAALANNRRVHVPRFTIFTTTFSSGELALTAERSGLVGYALTYSDRHMMNGVDVLHAAAGEKVVISAEALSRNDAHVCRNLLLPQFITDIVERHPLIFKEAIDEFLAAARRK